MHWSLNPLLADCFPCGQGLSCAVHGVVRKKRRAISYGKQSGRSGKTCNECVHNDLEESLAQYYNPQLWSKIYSTTGHNRQRVDRLDSQSVTAVNPAKQNPHIAE